MLRIDTGAMENLSPLRKIILMVLLSLGSMMVFMIIGWLFAMLIFDDFHVLFTQLGDFENAGVITVMKYFQIVNQFGLFIIPPLLFAYLVGGNIPDYLNLQRNPGLLVLVLSTIAVFAILPLIHWSAGLNELLRFPEWLKGLEDWMKQSEENAMKITEAFLNANTVGGFIVNLIIIAILPAVGEELLFRGVLQKLFQQWLKNVHFAILITAVLFSALHFQFYGFLPRTILGVMFGYLFVITKSLWVSILVHFLNNSAAVLAAFLFQKKLIRSNYDEIGNVTNPFWIVGSLIVVCIIFVMIYRISMLQAQKNQEQT